MELVIFTDSKVIKNSFSLLEKSKAVDLVYISRKTIRKDIRNFCKKDIIYIDISGYSVKEINSLLTFLTKNQKQSFGIIDPEAKIDDIADLFFRNISDYIGKRLLKNKIKTIRIKKAIEARNLNLEEEETVKFKEDHILVNDWSEIKPGKEYTFIFLYIGIDNTNILKQRFNASILAKMQNNLRIYLENFLKPYNGRMWIWNDFSGIILFPFNGKYSDAFLAACKLHLNQRIISIESLNINAIITFRLVMHIGNTVFRKRGSTGNIISNTMNSIFHIGQKFIEPRNFNITDDVLLYLKNGLKENFVPYGDFEGNKIYKFKI
jgi:hypothetical protein